MKKIKVLIIALKNSKRLPYLKKKLNKLKIKFKIIEGINGNYYYGEKKLDKISNEKKIYKTIGRTMSPSEIGAAASHIKAYKFIVKNKIDQAIIFEDDSIPSNILKEWINNNYQLENNEILSFFAYPSGFLEKKPFKKILNNKINLHYAKTHIYSNSCYQINNSTIGDINSGINFFIKTFFFPKILFLEALRFDSPRSLITVKNGSVTINLIEWKEVLKGQSARPITLPLVIESIF